MTELTSGLDSALSGANPLVFGAVEILLPGYNLRLLDGAGVLSWGGKTFVGRDPTFGVLAAIEDLTDGIGDEAPAINITLHPASDAAAATLAAPTMQGSQVSIWIGAVDPVSGAVIADPYLLFLGEMDVPILKSSANSRVLEYEVVSVFERFFTDDEGARLSDGFHQSVWPGERGLESVTGVENTIYWGVEGPANTVVAPAPGPYTYPGWGFSF